MEKYMEVGNMDSYYEQVVKRKMSSSTVSAVVLGLIAVATVMVLSVWLSLTVAEWLFPLAIITLGVGIYLVYFILKNSRVEYEYTFVLGEMRISKIKGKSRRKKVTHFDVKAIDDIGKYIDPETGRKNVDTSKYPNKLHAAVDDENLDTYYMVIHDKVRQKPGLLLFTPNERTLEMIKPCLSVTLKKKFIALKKEEDKRLAELNGNSTDTSSNTEKTSKSEDVSAKAEKPADTSVSKNTSNKNTSAEKVSSKKNQSGKKIGKSKK